MDGGEANGQVDTEEEVQGEWQPVPRGIMPAGDLRLLSAEELLGRLEEVGMPALRRRPPSILSIKRGNTMDFRSSKRSKKFKRPAPKPLPTLLREAAVGSGYAVVDVVAEWLVVVQHIWDEWPGQTLPPLQLHNHLKPLFVPMVTYGRIVPLGTGMSTHGQNTP